MSHIKLLVTLDAPVRIISVRQQKLIKWHINKWGQIVPLTEDEQNPGREVHKSIPIAIAVIFILIFLFGVYRHVSA